VRWFLLRRLSALTALIAASILAVPVSAFAWGVAGHATIAEIAETRLSATALAEVRQLLAVKHVIHLAEIASWPDEWRVFHPETGPWHFVDIPLFASGYEPARDCAGDNCVVAKIEEFASVLADRRRPDEERFQALAYVVHFIGDVHQPLHASNDDDAGGNKIIVTYFGQTKSDRRLPWNLHSVWDTAIIEHHLASAYGEPTRVEGVRSDVRLLAHKLSAKVTRREAAGWTKGGLQPIAWANQSHDLARTVAYRGIIDADGAPLSSRTTVGTDYDERAWKVIELQIERAGVRLASVLNASLSVQVK
jgi:hypothetical protein